MTRLVSRRAALAGAGLVLLIPERTAHALDEASVAALLAPNDPDVQELVKNTSGHAASAPWGPPEDGLWAACLAQEGNTVIVGLIQDGADGKTGRIVAGPADADILSIDPFWTVDVSISPSMPLGPHMQAFGVTVSNSYVSTGRSTYSESMSIFLRHDDTLRLAFSGYVRAGSSEVVDCRKRRPGGEPCRKTWDRKWIIKTDGPAAGGTPPPLIVIERPAQRVVSRHTWRGDHYDPPTFEKLPDLRAG